MKIRLFIIISFFILIGLSINVNEIFTSAHSPQDMLLNYDYVNQELSATFTHVVVNTNTHFITRVEISKNGELHSTHNYTSQPTNSQYTYIFEIEAEDGDVLTVKAICSLFGSLTKSLTVNESQQATGEIEIGEVSSGIFSIYAEIKNIAEEEAENINWEISAVGGIFGLLNQKRVGRIDKIPAGGSITVRSGFIFALGDVLITVKAGSREDFEVEKNIKGTGRIFGVNIKSDLKVNFESIAEGFNSPVDLTYPKDGTDRLFIVDQVGLIHVIKNGILQSEPFLNVSDKMVNLRENFDERGLLGLVFHPDYENNGRFFVYYSAPAEDENYNHTSIIAEYHVSSENENIADPNSKKIILKVNQPEFNHNGGQLLFGPDGYLFIALGDGGGADDVHGEIGNGQNKSNLLGSILRIDVDSSSPYSIPPDNPFVGEDGRDEIYAYGFRNPWRFSYDEESNRFYVADVGQNKFEELNIMEKRKNYGWRIMEGFHEFDPELSDELGIDIEDLANPIVEYSHGIGRSIVGGYVYHGNINPVLKDKYIFGDWSDGFFPPKPRLFYLEETEKFGFIRYEFKMDDVSIPYLLGFGQDKEGEVYVLTSETLGPTGTTGEVSRIRVS